jgi:hypothetical protein
MIRVSSSGALSQMGEVGGWHSYRWNWCGDTIPNQRAFLWRRQSTATDWGVQDYNANLINIAFNLTGDSVFADYVACATHGTYVSGNSGLVRVDDPFNDGPQTTVSGHGSAFSYVRSGRRLRRAVVAVRGTPTIAALHASGNGTAWQVIAPPPVSDLSKIVLACEVLERGT